MIAWNVYKNSINTRSKKKRHIDTVFFTSNCNENYVKDCLINKDGYNPDITIKKARS